MISSHALSTTQPPLHVLFLPKSDQLLEKDTTFKLFDLSLSTHSICSRLVGLMKNHRPWNPVFGRRNEHVVVTLQAIF